MEFVEEDQEEELEIQLPSNQEFSVRSKMAGAGAGVFKKPQYKECLKNHAVAIGGHALDGCGEFMPAGKEGSVDALKCAACNCHRNFHRKVQQQNYSAYNAVLPSTPRYDQDDISNPSSSGGGSKKRFRTKFTQDQKDKMLELSEKLGWRIQKHDDSVVQHFCSETGVMRQALKVWMHNNKNTLGKNNPTLAP